MFQQAAVRFGKLFEGEVYHVPDYQRSYAWTEKQLIDLWSDLLETMGTQARTQHFMGTLVLKPTQDAIQKRGRTYVVWEVVDGQQRLTTLTLLMACLARRFRKIPDQQDIANDIYDQFVVYSRNGVVDPDLQKLVIGGDDNSFFWSAIIRPEPDDLQPSTPGQRRLWQARQFFESRLKAMAPERLPELRDVADGRLLFLTYVVGDDLEAGLVFETINDRGKSLSNLDKIKNYLMFVAAKHQSTTLSRAVNTHWGNVLRRVAELDPEDSEELEDALTRYHWIMETGDEKEYQVYRGVKARYPVAKPEAASEAEAYVARLSKAADLYVHIKRPREAALFPGAAEPVRRDIVHYLESIQRLRVEAIFVPLLLASLQTFAAAAGDFREIARLCYLLAWRAHRVCRRRSDAGSARLAGLACEVAGRKSSASEVKRSLQDLIERYGDDDEFKYNLRLIEGDNLKFLLYEWERASAEATRQDAVDWDAVRGYQVEHIWPQAPRGYSSWSADAQKEHDELINLPGNLTLVAPPWNPSLSNRPLHEKQDRYRTANLQITREIPAIPEFHEVCQLEQRKTSPRRVLKAVAVFVEARSEALVRFALERWKV